MTQTVNAKSVLTTTFHLGTFQMPVRLYKTTDVLGLSGKLFHDGCGGKIRQWKTCELHPNTEDPATFSGMEIGNKIVPLTQQLKEQLFDGNTEFRAIGAFKLSQFTQLTIERAIVPVDFLEVTPEKFFEKAFSTLLDRLRVRKQFLLVKFAKDNMRRFGIFLPNGIMVPVKYSEELRELHFSPVESDKKFGRLLNAELDKLESDDFPELSADDITQRIQSWFTDVALDRNIVAYTHKVVSVDA